MPYLLLIQTWSGSFTCRRFHYVLERLVTLCFSAILSFGENNRQDRGRHSRKCSSGCAHMAHSTILWDGTPSHERETHSPASRDSNTVVPPLGYDEKVPCKEVKISFTTFIHYLLCKKRMPQRVVDHITSNSWKKSSLSKLNTSTTRWLTYCKLKCVPVGGFTGNQCLAFLDYCVHALKLSFYAMGAQKEFLFSVSKLLNNKLSVSDKECITKYVKGCFNSKSPIPHFRSAPVSWNVDIVLDHINADRDNMQLGMNELVGKITMLVLLANMCRLGDVAQLDLSNLSRSEVSLKFRLPNPTKTFTKAAMVQGGVSLQALEIEYFEVKKLCHARVIDCYIELTAGIRIPVTKLFIIAGGNPKPAARQAISRCAKKILQDAGLGKFTVHSGHSASASNALLLGLPISAVMACAGWKSKSTFIKKYMKNPQCNLHDVHGFSRLWFLELGGEYFHDRLDTKAKQFVECFEPSKKCVSTYDNNTAVAFSLNTKVKDQTMRVHRPEMKTEGQSPFTSFPATATSFKMPDWVPTGKSWEKLMQGSVTIIPICPVAPPQVLVTLLLLARQLVVWQQGAPQGPPPPYFWSQMTATGMGVQTLSPLLNPANRLQIWPMMMTTNIVKSPMWCPVQVWPKHTPAQDSPSSPKLGSPSKSEDEGPYAGPHTM